MIKFFREIKEALYPKYHYLRDRDYRVNIYDGNPQGFSAELGKWKDLCYLQGTAYDSGQWLNLPSHIRMEICLMQKGLNCAKDSTSF